MLATRMAPPKTYGRTEGGARRRNGKAGAQTSGVRNFHSKFVDSLSERQLDDGSAYRARASLTASAVAASCWPRRSDMAPPAEAEEEAEKRKKNFPSSLCESVETFVNWPLVWELRWAFVPALSVSVCCTVQLFQFTLRCMREEEDEEEEESEGRGSPEPTHGVPVERGSPLLDNPNIRFDIVLGRREPLHTVEAIPIGQSEDIRTVRRHRYAMNLSYYNCISLPHLATICNLPSNQPDTGREFEAHNAIRSSSTPVPERSRVTSGRGFRNRSGRNS